MHYNFAHMRLRLDTPFVIQSYPWCVTASIRMHGQRAARAVMRSNATERREKLKKSREDCLQS